MTSERLSGGERSECKGSWGLETACGECRRCRETFAQAVKALRAEQELGRARMEDLARLQMALGHVVQGRPERKPAVYDRSLLSPFSTWFHPGTGAWYVVLGIGQCSTNGLLENREESVIYWSTTYRGMRYREIGEFLDGRFVPMTLPKPATVQQPTTGSAP